MTDPTQLAECNLICEMGRRLHQKGWLAAADGNISVRLGSNEILITPTGVHKGYLEPSQMCLLSMDGEVISGKPSGERLMHLGVYRCCPKARAVIHAHPKMAIAWSIAQPDLKELPADVLAEEILANEKIPIVPYAKPGTPEMGDHLKPFLPQARMMILARHGALSWGEDLSMAYNGIERLEQVAKILAYTQMLKGGACL